MEAVLVLATVARSWRVGVPDGEAPVRPKPQVTLRPAGPVRLALQARTAANASHAPVSAAAD
jgi:hypothetical protein